MPELDYAVLCEHAKVDQGQLGYVIGAGIDSIKIPIVPAGINLGLLMRLNFSSNECGRPHRLEMFVQDMDGARILAMATIVEPNVPPGLPPHWPANVMLALNFGVPIPHYGEYGAEIMLNDTSKSTLRFRVLDPNQGNG